MKQASFAAAAAVVAALILGLGCTSQEAASDTASISASSAGPVSVLEELIPQLMKETRIPGLAVAVLQGGEVTWVEQFGVADMASGALVEPTTLFEAASLSKPVFAYMVLKLVDRGEIRLDQPLHELLEYERFAGDPRALDLTATVVLSHRSGLPNWGATPLEFEADPGERFGYSGEGYLYLQRVLEEQTGLPLDALARREVFEPLGMTESRFTWEEGEVVAKAIGHDGAEKPQSRDLPEANAAGSLHTTARDYAEFLAAMLAGNGLTRESVERAFQPVVWMTGEERGSDVAPEVARLVGWGHGWGVQQNEADRLVWHWGDNGTFRAFVALRPSSGDGVVYFTNSTNGLLVARQLVETVVGPMTPTFEWLDYWQSDQPGWSERQEGLLAEERKDYEAALEHFRAYLALIREDEGTRERASWLAELLRVRENPVEVPGELLNAYAGSYGPRLLVRTDDGLSYQREGRDPFELIPLASNLFALDGMVDFRIEVVTDDSGQATKLIGHYIGGTDESPRSPG